MTRNRYKNRYSSLPSSGSALQTNVVTEGSLEDVAKKTGKTVQEVLMDAEVIVLIDVSGSMGSRDVRHGEMSRYDAAVEQLSGIQADYPGKVGVVAFSSEVVFNPGGVPDYLGGSTKMSAAIKYAFPYDGLAKIVIISDGCPNSEEKTLEEARKFESKFHAIYIGPKDDREGGRKFLKRLVGEMGGKVTSKTPDHLAEGIVPLLAAQTSVIQL